MQHRPATIADGNTPGQPAPRRDSALVADRVTFGSATAPPDAAGVAQGGRARGGAIPAGVADGRS